MISYKQLIFNKEAILRLYLDNEWTAYTDEKELLFEGIKNSLDLIGAYHEEELIGLIRTIGDKNTIIYIQDILVLKKYHRKGVGTTLLEMIIEKYPHVRQICLTTGKETSQRLFYESLGFMTYDDGKIVGFIQKK